MKRFNKILVIQTAFIGDAVLATAAAESLHHAFPEAQIDLLVRAGNESLFEGHPFLRTLVWEKRSRKYRNLLHTIRRVRREGYDLVINLHRFATSGWITILSGATETRGYKKNPLSWAFTKSYEHRIGQKGDQEYLHEIDRNYSLISDLSPQRKLPRLYPERTLSEDQKNSLHALKKEPYICIAPASVWKTKAFPEAQWIEFIKELPNIAIHLIGGPDDYDLSGRIIRAVAREHIYNQCGKLNLNESASLMQGAQMNYVNDSAPLHLCGAVNAPVTAIFCSTIPEFGFGPVRENGHIIETNETLGCRPCGLHGKQNCPEGHFRCATSINVRAMKRTSTS